MPNNPYMEEIKANLPRILSLIDNDKSSSTFGMGDRYHWAWGLIDFGNGSFQGIAHGLARLWKSNLWPYQTTKKIFFNRINSLFFGAKKLTRNSGSLEEAFPNEGSYCVTALVSFDLLMTIELLSDDIDKETYNDWIEVIKPMIDYLKKADEKHAIISNHLATAVAALVLWMKITKDKSVEKKAKVLLNRILSNQSSEGWFKEYNGADPGYQSLCTYYLMIIHLNKPEWNLENSLSKSIDFLWNFAHPDGSFGGLYGSRCTRFFIPAGILAYSKKNIKALSLSKYMARSIQEKRVINLSSIDEPNLIPVFNSYCWAAELFENQNNSGNLLEIPSLSRETFSHYYDQAGLFIDKGINHYTIINTKRGGIIYHFCKGKLEVINGGVVVKNKKNIYGSSQLNSLVELSDNLEEIKIISAIGPMSKSRPKPWQFLLLRILSVSFFKLFFFREIIKKFLVRFLINDKKPWPVKNERIIEIGKNLKFYDSLSPAIGFEVVKDLNNFVPFHMASQGYWQIQDESIKTSNDSKI